MSQTGKSNASGFTLLEALVVIIILSLTGVIAGLAIPQARSRAVLAKARASIVRVLNNAKAEARRSASPHAVVFDLDSRRFHMEGSPEWHNLPTEVSLSVVSAQELGSPQRPRILFLADGTGSGAEVELTSGVYSVKIRVGWLTGRITDASF